ncbi:conserved hypothetical protein [Denitrovibrio acetiphilus DSM 12809]|uniref:Uncharacterized protein n=1 Tax=Denitrovibrio acetiphilus (strain DSM 12809 / NBRC 114555 / N2460) TaxID=522772 RepID=D4H0T6_DENA2|nr:hypothetical protein [Denitrovibrio acetiphilus]ADD68599.1 conserved hypothetical protein [Denitrovibrio acetiphilus DSM 12809]
MNTLQGVFAICAIAFLLNLPFGWLRTYTRKFSIGWAVCIHAPIPMIAFMRIYTHIDWVYIPLFFLFSIAGQILGGKLKERIRSS